jgi:hypothetical protein
VRDAQGNVLEMVAKLMRKGALISEAEREWRTGLQLNPVTRAGVQQLQTGIHGFVKTGPAVRLRCNGKMIGAAFLGELLTIYSLAHFFWLPGACDTTTSYLTNTFTSTLPSASPTNT